MSPSLSAGLFGHCRLGPHVKFNVTTNRKFWHYFGLKVFRGKRPMVIHAVSQTSLLHVLCSFCLQGVSHISCKVGETGAVTQSSLSIVLMPLLSSVKHLLWSTASFHMLKVM